MSQHESEPYEEARESGVDETNRGEESLTPVVGIGASAGGLAAFRVLLETLPPNTGFAFVVVQHLDPTHPSMMADLLGRCTEMPVTEVGDGERVEPDHVYVIPPDSFLTLEDGCLRLERPSVPRGARMSIDHFFRSIAQRGASAIGIVLSGTGTDGTAGLRAIRAAGGLTIAQKPSTAAHEGMPHSAISARVADMVLDLDRIPEALRRFAEHPYLRPETEPPASSAEEPEIDLEAISSILSRRVGLDASLYKPKTVERRIRRRMGLRHLEHPSDYLAALRTEEEEVRALSRDLLISVTDFFRDPEPFEFLSEQIVPELIDGSGGDPVRVWIPACATGEEAYSIAILFLEEFARRDGAPAIQVFATDIDRAALDFARDGVYPESSLAAVSGERLERFFRSTGDHRYRVTRDVRDRVSFATHDVLADAPFSRLDLISCRNLLIYLRRDAQRELAALFHFALKSRGVLFLGESETPMVGQDTFKIINKRHRVYRRVGRNRRTLFRAPKEPRVSGEPCGDNTAVPSDGISAIACRMLLDASEVAAAVVDAEGDVHYLHGPVNRYLELPQGQMRSSLFSMLDGDLRSRVRAALSRVVRKETAFSFDFKAEHPEGREETRVRVEPSRTPDAEGLFAVFFEPIRLVDDRVPPRDEDEDRSMVTELERELAETREDLRTTIEELETSNEELKSSNEEAMSMNEELQSSTEELEASAEELRSLNDELLTVNAELREKLDQLEQANDDLSNFFASTKLATVFLSNDLTLKRWTPAAATLLDLRPADEGRGLASLVRGLDADCERDAREVLDRLHLIEKELQFEDGRHFRRSILPYRTGDDRIAGVVVTFTDITELVSTADQLAARARQQEAVALLGLNALRSQVDIDDLLSHAPRAVTAVLDVEFAKVLELVPDGPSLLLRAGVGWAEGLVGHATLPTGPGSQGGFTLAETKPVVVWDLETDARFNGPKLLREHGVRSGLSCIIYGPSGPWGVIGAHTRSLREFSEDDVNFLQGIANVLSHAIHRESMERSLRANEALYRATFEDAPVGIAHVGLAGELLQFNEALCAICGYSAEELQGRTFAELGHPDDAKLGAEKTEALLRGERGSCTFEQRYRHRDGSILWVNITVCLLVGNNDEPQHFIAVIQDITDARRAAESLRRKTAELEDEDRRKELFLATLGHEIRNPLAALTNGLNLATRGLRDFDDLRPMMIAHLAQLTTLVNDLLELSRITRGKISLRRRTVDLTEIARTALETAQPALEARSQELSLSLPESLTLAGDPTRIEQMLSNLLSNATKYTPEGGRIEMSVRREEDDAVIAVSDTGRGLSGAQIESIFDPFVQEDPGVEGLGIGLALVRGLADLHGGTITAQSKGRGKGSTFILTLPIGEAVTPPPKRDADPPDLPPGLRILVVDDMRDSADMLAMLLGAMGAETAVAYDGESAIEKFESWPPDVALIDIGLPDITGHEVAERIRALPNGADALVLAVTGFGDRQTEASALNAGFDERLLKPVDPEHLSTVIHEHRARRGR